MFKNLSSIRKKFFSFPFFPLSIGGAIFLGLILGRESTYLEFKIKSSEELSPQLFFDVGRGWDENDSSRGITGERLYDGEFLKLSFLLPLESIQKFRVDLANLSNRRFALYPNRRMLRYICRIRLHSRKCVFWEICL
jgi:hypothetical protein